MTVPIKQLQDKNNQDFYPETVKAAVADYDAITADDVAETEPVEPVVTTAMIVDNAITTSKISDGAVTPRKIDFSSFVYSDVAHLDMNIGWQITARLHRIGNMVVVNGKYNNGQAIPANSSIGEMSEHMPSGFRPASGSSATIIGTAPNHNATFSWGVLPTGKVEFWSGGVGVPTTSVITINGIWFTNDEYPTNEGGGNANTN